jgi:hypothetical protein
MSKPLETVVDRRTTLRWLVASIASGTMLGACGSAEEEAAVQALADLGIPATPDGVKYGTDPDLLNPVLPWQRTMTEQQLQLAATLSDAILPASDTSPSASEVGVQDFIDEWVSAPYDDQQEDRQVILDGLTWLEQESLDRFSVSVADAGESQQTAILDDIAFRDRVKSGLEEAADFFRRFRHLAMSAYYSTEAGMAEIGYIGNTPLPGDYPGPTPEALAHLDAALKRLGLA